MPGAECIVFYQHEIAAAGSESRNSPSTSSLQPFNNVLEENLLVSLIVSAHTRLVLYGVEAYCCTRCHRNFFHCGSHIHLGK